MHFAAKCRLNRTASACRVAKVLYKLYFKNSPWEMRHTKFLEVARRGGMSGVFDGYGHTYHPLHSIYTKYCHVYGGTHYENNGFWFGCLDLLALWLQSCLITVNTGLSLIYTLSSPPLDTHWDSQSSLVVSWQWISNTESSTSNHYEVFLPFLVQSPWNLGTQLKLSWTPH
jgi:hypothetical protein